MVVVVVCLWWYVSQENELKKVRSECHFWAMSAATNQFNQKKAMAPAWQQAQMPDGNFYTADYEIFYQECLRSHGIREGR